MDKYINQVLTKVPMSKSEQDLMKPVIETAYKFRTPLWHVVSGLTDLMQKARKTK